MKLWRHLSWLVLAPTLSGCEPACISTDLGQIRDPAGIVFKLTRTDCDTIAKDSAISVTASRGTDDSAVLLFKYDPRANEIPQVRVERETIIIHLSHASSILEQTPTWGAFKVEIKVDELAYP